MSVLPAATAAVAAYMLVGLILATSANIEPLTTTFRARALLLVLTMPPLLLMVALAQGRPPATAGLQPRGHYAPTRARLIACLPALGLVLIAIHVAASASATDLDGMFTGWDSINHVLMSAQVQRDGHLSYSDSAYPRGMHALIALSAAATGSTEPSAEQMLHLIRAQWSLVWLALACWSAAVSLSVLSICQRQAWAAPGRHWAAAGGGLLPLMPSFFGFSVSMGFVTSVVLAALLAILVLELVEDATSPLALGSACCVVFLTAHTWQLALPVPVALLVLLLVRRLRHHPRSAVRLTVATALLLLATMPPVQAAWQELGVKAVATDGQLAPLPGPAYGLALLCFVVRRDARRDLGLLLAAFVPAGYILLSIALGAVSDIGIGGYYPGKTLWHGVAAALPMVAVAVACALSGVISVAGRGSTQTWTYVLLLLGGALLMWHSIARVVEASAGNRSSAGVVAAVAAPDPKARLCELRSARARQKASKLLSFYSGESLPPSDIVAPMPACPGRRGGS